VTHEQMLYKRIYDPLVKRLGHDGADNWAKSTLITFKDGVYDTLDELIQSTIEEAQK